MTQITHTHHTEAAFLPIIETIFEIINTLLAPTVGCVNTFNVCVYPKSTLRAVDTHENNIEV